MNVKRFLLAEMNREANRSRRALEQVPQGKYDWKPHDKSMTFGYLANMVATIAMWISMQINQDEQTSHRSRARFERNDLIQPANYWKHSVRLRSVRRRFRATQPRAADAHWQLKAAGFMGSPSRSNDFLFTPYGREGADDLWAVIA